MKIKRTADNIARLEDELENSNIGILSNRVKNQHKASIKSSIYSKTLDSEII